MLRLMCKSKIHRATVTDANLNYMGSITVDEELLAAADILPEEWVQVVNITNGERFETYVIPGPAGRGDICLNWCRCSIGSSRRFGDHHVICVVDPGGDPVTSHADRACRRQQQNHPGEVLMHEALFLDPWVP